PASRVAEKIMGPGKHDKPHLLTQEIQRGRAQSASGQPLLHSGKAAFVRAQGKKLYLLVRIEAEMLKYQSSNRLKSTAGSVESNCPALKLLNGFKFRACDERAGGARHVTGQDSKRNSLDRCGGRIPNHRPVIKFSAD